VGASSIESNRSMGLKDIDHGYYTSKLLKPFPTILVIIEEKTSLGVRIRESKYPGCAKGANLSSRELVHELAVPSYGPVLVARSLYLPAG
jgi:hypothetical protein